MPAFSDSIILAVTVSWMVSFGVVLFSLDDFFMLKEDTTKPPASSLRAQQSRFDNFRYVFNNERPHEGLKNAVPASLYHPILSDCHANCRSSRTPKGFFCEK